MKSQIFKSVMISLGCGFLLTISMSFLQTDYLHNFFSNNLVLLLVALLAINSTTMSLVINKIKDISDSAEEKYKNEDFFIKTKQELLLSVNEQVTLIVLSILLLSVSHSPHIKNNENIVLLLNVCISSVFVYAISILHDTAKSILIVVNHSNK